MATRDAIIVNAVLDQVDSGLVGARTRLFDLLRIPASARSRTTRRTCSAPPSGWRRPACGPRVRRLGPSDRGDTPSCSAITPVRAGTKARASCSTATTMCSRPIRWSLWDSPAFVPQLVDGPHGKRIVARGAVDDKGQLMMFVEALRAWTDVGGGIPTPVTVLLEGEEEIGSPNLEPFLVAHKDALAADFALISDTNMWNIDTPGITTRLRGMCNCEITLKGPGLDLHSGLFGGSALTRLMRWRASWAISTTTTEKYKFPDFYDAVQGDFAGPEGRLASAPIRRSRVPARHRPISPERRAWVAGAAAHLGAAHRRPQRDVGRLHGRRQQDIIPSEASAKVSFRLVPDQDPHAVFEAFQRFVADRLPPGARSLFQGVRHVARHGDRGRQPWVNAARAALQEEYGRPP